MKEGASNFMFPKKSVIKFEFPARGSMPPVKLFWYDGLKEQPKLPGVPQNEYLGDLPRIPRPQGQDAAAPQSGAGSSQPGVVGQVFLNTGAPSYKAAEVAGDLTVTVHDTTPRPPGAAAMRPEVWHFTQDVLEKMGIADERFGRSLVVFRRKVVVGR